MKKLFLIIATAIVMPYVGSFLKFNLDTVASMTVASCLLIALDSVCDEIIYHIFKPRDQYRISRGDVFRWHKWLVNR